MKRSGSANLIFDLEAGQDHPGCLEGRTVDLLSSNVDWSDLETKFGHISRGMALISPVVDVWHAFEQDSIEQECESIFGSKGCMSLLTSLSH